MGGHLGGRDNYIGDGGRGGTVGGKGQLHGRWWEGRKCGRGETATWEMVGGEGLREGRDSHMGRQLRGKGKWEGRTVGGKGQWEG